MATAFLESTTPDCVEGIVVDVQGPHSYERMEGEPIGWYARFQKFMLQGTRRSLLSVYKAEVAESNRTGPNRPDTDREGPITSIPGAWKRQSETWNWNSRCGAYDVEQLEAEKKQVESDRAARRRTVLEDEYNHGTQMVETASEALKHGHKFFERTTKFIAGKPQLQTVKHPKTGKDIEMLVVTNREVVYLELKAGDINRMLMDGGKKRRMAVNLSSDKAQSAFENTDTGEAMDVEAFDKELYEMFEQLGMNKLPPGAPQADDDELPGDIERPTGPPDELLPGFDY